MTLAHCANAAPQLTCMPQIALLAEVPVFREGESGSDGEPSGSDVSSEEEGSEGSESEGGSDDGSDEAGGSDSEADQDALDADLAPRGTANDTSDEEESGSEGSDDDEEGSGAGKKRKAGESFLDGAKSDTFARAFTRVLDSATGKSGAAGAPILAGSKSIAARRAEEEAEAKADRAAKRLRLEMRRRGHVVPKRRGGDPTADASEKALQKTATRGVVRLFNAVAKAQRRLREERDATGSRSKAARLGKASFLAELKNSRAAGAGTETVVPAARAPSALKPPTGDSSDEEGGAGWEVLQEGFTGLQGGSKMKDWDREGSGGDESDGPSDLGGGSDSE